MWESAFVSSKENEVAVEIPLWAKPLVYYVFDENVLAYDETGNRKLSDFLHPFGRLDK